MLSYRNIEYTIVGGEYGTLLTNDILKRIINNNKMNFEAISKLDQCLVVKHDISVQLEFIEKTTTNNSCSSRLSPSFPILHSCVTAL